MYWKLRRGFEMLALTALVTVTAATPAAGQRPRCDELGWVQTAPVRKGAAVVYDPVGRRLLVFGGRVASSPKHFEHNDVWALSVPNDGPSRWTQLKTDGEPPPTLFGAKAVYDSIERRMIVYGGTHANRLERSQRIWTLSLLPNQRPTWRTLPTTREPPGRIISLLFDAQLHRLIALAARGEHTGDLDAPWILPLAGKGQRKWRRLSWRTRPVELVATGPAVYDPVGQRVLFKLNHNWGVGTIPIPEVGGRSRLRVYPARRMPRKSREAWTYDPVAHRVLSFGGKDPNGSPGLNDTWALPLGSRRFTWTRLTSNGVWPAPSRRYSPTLAFDRERSRMLLYGGVEFSFSRYLGRRPVFARPVVGDAWSLDLGTEANPRWKPLETPMGMAPVAHYDARAAYDKSAQRMVLFGGRGPTGTLATVVGLHLPSDGTARWQQPEISGPSPGARKGHSWVYDAAGDRMILFGGTDQEFSRTSLGETWALRWPSGQSKAKWTRLRFTGSKSPPPRRFHAAIYDAGNERMIVLGGVAGLRKRSARRKDVWALSLRKGVAPSWRQLHPIGRMPHVAGAIYDPVRKRAIVFEAPKRRGGRTIAGDVWSLSLPARGRPRWRKITSGAHGPSWREGRTVVYDANNRRLILFGGYSVRRKQVYPTDVWALTLPKRGKSRWRRLRQRDPRPSGRSFPTAVFDAANSRMVIVGGWSGYSRLTDVWMLPLPRCGP